MDLFLDFVTFSAILDNNATTRWRSCRRPEAWPWTICTVVLCNAAPGVRWPPGGSTTGMLRHTSVIAVGFNTFLALLPEIYNKISVTIDWLSKICNNHVIRANTIKVHAVVIVDICDSVIGLHHAFKNILLGRYDVAVNLKCICTFSRLTMGKFAYLHMIWSIETLERDFGLLTLWGDTVNMITLFKGHFYYVTTKNLTSLDR